MPQLMQLERYRLVAYSQAKLAAPPSTRWQLAACFAGRAVAGLDGKHRGADVDSLAVRRNAGLGQGVIDSLHLGGQLAGLAGLIQRLDRLGTAHVGRVLAGEGELRQAQRVGAW